MRFSFLALLALSVSAAQADSFDLENDFNVSTGQGGPFSAGWRPTILGTSFSRFTNLQQLPGFLTLNAGPSHIPSLGIARPNGSNPYYIHATSSEVGIHPGDQGEICVVRFTAPETSTYRLAYDFELRDSFNEDGRHAADVGAYLLAAGVLIDSRQLTAYPQMWSGSTTLQMLQGETFEMAIDRGLSGNFGNDWTRVELKVNAVPEPASCLAVGLPALVILRRRKRA